MSAPPVVVGMGPCGLFAALTLAENGYAPILLERGDSVEDRVKAVATFYRDGILDTRSNIQFGAGGAGTFSDGKLMTRINDPFCGDVLRAYVRFGAPEEILTEAKPHIGTDVLRGVVSSMLAEIERLGGKLCYRTQLTDFTERPDGTLTVTTDRGQFSAGSLILALGHSARDSYFMLMNKQMVIEPKPISVGVRIEHRQEDIDRALFGSRAGDPRLGKGEYSLSDTTGARGVYTFCMCPGGQVVAAASEEETVVVNGMSVHARDGVNANAALAVSVGVNDFEPVEGSVIRGAIAFQRKIEHAAYVAGGSNYHVPVQTVGDFLAGVTVHEPGRVQPSYRDGNHFRVAPMDAVLPPFVTENLRRGLRSFDRKLHGFAAPDAVLSGAETRTSAPLRILRTEGMNAVGHPSVYPCGEGAGYAGGITSASVDGIRAALAVMARFSQPKGNR